MNPKDERKTSSQVGSYQEVKRRRLDVDQQQIEHPPQQQQQLISQQQQHTQHPSQQQQQQWQQLQLQQQQLQQQHQILKSLATFSTGFVSHPENLTTDQKLKKQQQQMREIEHQTRIEGSVKKPVIISKRAEAFKRITRNDAEAEVGTTQKNVQSKTVVIKMETSVSGPLRILYDCMTFSLKAKVWIRRYKGLRGVISGYIVAFDGHMNLAMIDVDEIYTIESWMVGEPLKKYQKQRLKKQQEKRYMRQFEQQQQPTVSFVEKVETTLSKPNKKVAPESTNDFLKKLTQNIKNQPSITPFQTITPSEKEKIPENINSKDVAQLTGQRDLWSVLKTVDFNRFLTAGKITRKASTSDKECCTENHDSKAITPITPSRTMKLIEISGLPTSPIYGTILRNASDNLALDQAPVDYSLTRTHELKSKTPLSSLTANESYSSKMLDDPRLARSNSNLTAFTEDKYLHKQGIQKSSKVISIHNIDPLSEDLLNKEPVRILEEGKKQELEPTIKPDPNIRTPEHWKRNLEITKAQSTENAAMAVTLPTPKTGKQKKNKKQKLTMDMIQSILKAVHHGNAGIEISHSVNETLATATTINTIATSDKAPDAALSSSVSTASFTSKHSKIPNKSITETTSLSNTLDNTLEKNRLDDELFMSLENDEDNNFRENSDDDNDDDDIYGDINMEMEFQMPDEDIVVSNETIENSKAKKLLKSERKAKKIQRKLSKSRKKKERTSSNKTTCEVESELSSSSWMDDSRLKTNILSTETGMLQKETNKLGEEFSTKNYQGYGDQGILDTKQNQVTRDEISKNTKKKKKEKKNKKKRDVKSRSQSSDNDLTLAEANVNIKRATKTTHSGGHTNPIQSPSLLSSVVKPDNVKPCTESSMDVKGPVIESAHIKLRAKFSADNEDTVVEGTIVNSYSEFSGNMKGAAVECVEVKSFRNSPMDIKVPVVEYVDVKHHPVPVPLTKDIKETMVELPEIKSHTELLMDMKRPVVESIELKSYDVSSTDVEGTPEVKFILESPTDVGNSVIEFSKVKPYKLHSEDIRYSVVDSTEVKSRMDSLTDIKYPVDQPSHDMKNPVDEPTKGKPLLLSSNDMEKSLVEPATGKSISESSTDMEKSVVESTTGKSISKSSTDMEKSVVECTTGKSIRKSLDETLSILEKDVLKQTLPDCSLTVNIGTTGNDFDQAGSLEDSFNAANTLLLLANSRPSSPSRDPIGSIIAGDLTADATTENTSKAANKVETTVQNLEEEIGKEHHEQALHNVEYVERDKGDIITREPTINEKFNLGVQPEESEYENVPIQSTDNVKITDSQMEVESIQLLKPASVEAEKEMDLTEQCFGLKTEDVTDIADQFDRKVREESLQWSKENQNKENVEASSAQNMENFESNVNIAKESESTNQSATEHVPELTETPEGIKHNNVTEGIVAEEITPVGKEENFASEGMKTGSGSGENKPDIMGEVLSQGTNNATIKPTDEGKGNSVGFGVTSLTSRGDDDGIKETIDNPERIEGKIISIVLETALDELKNHTSNGSSSTETACPTVISKKTYVKSSGEQLEDVNRTDSDSDGEIKDSDMVELEEGEIQDSEGEDFDESEFKGNGEITTESEDDENIKSEIIRLKSKGGGDLRSLLLKRRHRERDGKEEIYHRKEKSHDKIKHREEDRYRNEERRRYKEKHRNSEHNEYRHRRRGEGEQRKHLEEGEQRKHRREGEHCKHREEREHRKHREEGDHRKHREEGEQQKQRGEREQRKHREVGEELKLREEGEQRKQRGDGEQRKHIEEGVQRKYREEGEQRKQRGEEDQRNHIEEGVQRKYREEGEQRKQRGEGEHWKHIEKGVQRKHRGEGELRKLREEGEHRKHREEEEQRKHRGEGEKRKHRGEGEQRKLQEEGDQGKHREKPQDDTNRTKVSRDRLYEIGEKYENKTPSRKEEKTCSEREEENRPHERNPSKEFFEKHRKHGSKPGEEGLTVEKDRDGVTSINERRDKSAVKNELREKLVSIRKKKMLDRLGIKSEETVGKEKDRQTRSKKEETPSFSLGHQEKDMPQEKKLAGSDMQRNNEKLLESETEPKERQNWSTSLRNEQLKTKPTNSSEIKGENRSERNFQNAKISKHSGITHERKVKKVVENIIQPRTAKEKEIKLTAKITGNQQTMQDVSNLNIFQRRKQQSNVDYTKTYVKRTYGWIRDDDKQTENTDVENVDAVKDNEQNDGSESDLDKDIVRQTSATLQCGQMDSANESIGIVNNPFVSQQENQISTMDETVHEQRKRWRIEANKRRGREKDDKLIEKLLGKTFQPNVPVKGLIYKKRHLNQLFVRGENVIMIAYDKPENWEQIKAEHEAKKKL